jgi:hypothetical protein
MRDMMPVLFELLAEEPDPAVRIVLEHFIFVYIHPYTDGNGRMGRFLMNVRPPVAFEIGEFRGLAIPPTAPAAVATIPEASIEEMYPTPAPGG